MSNITGTVRASLKSATGVTIYNVSAPTAGVEVSQALSANTKKFTLRVRGNSTLQLAFVATESSTTFLTIPARSSYSEDIIDFSGTIYFQCDKASQTVEIIEWV